MFDSSELRMPRKQASWLAAFLIFCFFIAFTVGYYLGKQHGAQVTTGSDVSVQTIAPEFSVEQESISFRQTDPPVAKDKGMHVAQLVGYGTHKKAEAFVNRLAKRGIATDLKKRVSSTKSGKKITWYQVVTKPYAHKNELQSLVDRIVKLEHIRNYQIVKHRR